VTFSVETVSNIIQTTVDYSSASQSYSHALTRDAELAIQIKDKLDMAFLAFAREYEDSRWAQFKPARAQGAADWPPTNTSHLSSWHHINAQALKDAGAATIVNRLASELIKAHISPVIAKNGLANAYEFSYKALRVRPGDRRFSFISQMSSAAEYLAYDIAHNMALRLFMKYLRSLLEYQGQLLSDVTLPGNARADVYARVPVLLGAPTGDLKDVIRDAIVSACDGILDKPTTATMVELITEWVIDLVLDADAKCLWCARQKLRQGGRCEWPPACESAAVSWRFIINETFAEKAHEVTEERMESLALPMCNGQLYDEKGFCVKLCASILPITLRCLDHVSREKHRHCDAFGGYGSSLAELSYDSMQLATVLPSHVVTGTPVHALTATFLPIEVHMAGVARDPSLLCAAGGCAAVDSRSAYADELDGVDFGIIEEPVRAASNENVEMQALACWGPRSNHRPRWMDQDMTGGDDFSGLQTDAIGRTKSNEMGN